MNKIETMFYDALNRIISSNTEKVLELEDGEEVKYQFYTPDFGTRKLKVTRTFFPESRPIDTFFLVYTNDEKLEIKGYYPDFTINLGTSGYVIEIDGYEWHEKTKEQAINDRKKDRAYIKSGYIPVRFLGAEIYHDAKKCAEEFIELLIENEFQLFNRDSIMNIEMQNLQNGYEVKRMERCIYGLDTMKALFINEHKKVISPLKYEEKYEA